MGSIKFGFGPMSHEIIEAVFEYSHNYDKELMLIASKNQIDWDDGYVNTTEEFAKNIEELRKKYVNSSVMICRDHCGPGFKNSDYNSIYDVEQTIRTDIECGFDLIHIDLCHYYYDIVEQSCELMEYARELNPNIKFEIGTDDIEDTVGTQLIDFDKKIQPFIDFTPLYYVINTGSLIKENKQIGTFKSKLTGAFGKILEQYNIGIKEHNADYLSASQIHERIGCVDAMNIAPQLGVVQTFTILNEAQKYGINVDNFVNLVYNKGRWKKWDNGNLDGNPYLSTIVAGHYHFGSDEYKRIVDQINDVFHRVWYETIEEGIRLHIIDVIEHYVTAGNNNDKYFNWMLHDRI